MRDGFPIQVYLLSRFLDLLGGSMVAIIWDDGDVGKWGEEKEGEGRRGEKEER